MRFLSLSASLLLVCSQLTAQTGTFTTFGKACKGTDGLPAIGSPDKPTIGKSFSLLLSNGKKNGSAFLIFGATKTDYKGLKLPFDMEPLGAKGCSILVGYSVLVATKLDANGKGVNTYAIPNNSSLVGITFYNQYYVRDAKANALGGITSNASESKVGK